MLHPRRAGTPITTALAGLVIAVSAMTTVGATGVARAAEPIVPVVDSSTTALATGSAAPCPTTSAHPWCDPRLSADRRARLFLQAMTPLERITLLGGDGATNNGVLPIGHTGATMAVPRLGLPAVLMTDGPVGVRSGEATAMPIPLALGASMDARLARAYGRTIATEARAKGNDVLFGPAVDVMRAPQAGRTYENYGEETLLTARTGLGWIRGAQSAGVIATVKHFAAYNQEGQLGLPPFAAVDGGRQLVNVKVDQRTLHEVHLPQFETAVKQGRVGTLMCSYNSVNGTKACENRGLLTHVLRGQWGFRGVVMSDYAATLPTSTVPGLTNGLDFVPAQNSLDQAYSPALIAAALASGQVSAATVNQHVLRILRTLFASGYFDRGPFQVDEASIPRQAHSRLAQAVEERAITLLKNTGVLPLRPSVRTIAVIGPYADQFVTGGGSGAVRPAASAVVTALDGIIARAGSKARVTHADGSDPAEAARLAESADVAVMVVGDVMTEGQDKSCLGLNCSSDLINSRAVLSSRGMRCFVDAPCPLNGQDQDGLITRVAAAQPNTVVVLETGGPVLTPWRSKVAAVVAAWYPGQRGGAAIARVLFGDVDPGGRLPVTFPAAPSQVLSVGDTARYPGVGNQEQYSERLLVGYKWYDAHGFKPAYPFGAGLSYAHVKYGKATLRRGGARGAVATVSLTITNTSRRAGRAVPQLYISKPRTSRLRQPVRQLVGFRSVLVAPGRTVRVSIPLNDRSFASWDPRAGSQGGWRIVRGCYRFSLGVSSRQFSSRPVVGRGATCRAGTLRLPVRGLMGTPLPPDSTARTVGR